jgi:hypothetical protein
LRQRRLLVDVFGSAVHRTSSSSPHNAAYDATLIRPIQYADARVAMVANLAFTSSNGWVAEIVPGHNLADTNRVRVLDANLPKKDAL